MLQLCKIPHRGILYSYKIYPHRVFVKRHFLILASSSLVKTDPYNLHLHDSVAGLGKEAEQSADGRV